MTAAEALSTIRTALTAEIEVSVVPELVTAFETLDKLLDTDITESKTASPWYTNPELISNIGDRFKAIQSRFGALAEEIGQPDELDQFDIAAKLLAVGDEFKALASVLKGATPDEGEDVVFENVTAEKAKSLDDYATKLGFPDRNGKQLRVGDLVTFTGSNRFGSGEATVISVGDNDNPNDSDDRRRPRLSLANGETDDYQPSAGRVERIKKAVKPDEATADTAADTVDSEAF